jgi:hypothetical protein
MNNFIIGVLASLTAMFIGIVIEKVITKKWFGFLKVLFLFFKNYKFYSKFINEAREVQLKNINEKQLKSLVLISSNSDILSRLTDPNISLIEQISKFSEQQFKELLSILSFPYACSSLSCLSISKIEHVTKRRSPEREIDYRVLKDGAKKSIYIFGIGLTNVSKDFEPFVEYLSNGVNVQVLMLNPNIFSPNDICHTNPKQFDDFFKRYGYNLDIKKSLDNFTNNIIPEIKKLNEKFVAEENNQSNKMDFISVKFELKVYNVFIPINITIRDCEHDDGELILEYCYPYTMEERLKIHASNGKIDSVFKKGKYLFEEIWKNDNITNVVEYIELKVPKKQCI